MTATEISQKMIRELERTIRAYEVIQASGNNNLAQKVFEEFMAQQKLVQNVLDVTIDLEDKGEHYEVVVYFRKEQNNG